LLEEGSGIKVAINDPLAGHEQLLKSYTEANMHNVLAYGSRSGQRLHNRA
jgi:hypothetical protein